MSRSPWPRLPDGPIRVGVRSREVGHNGSVTRTTDANLLPAELTAAIERAGYHPAIVSDVVLAALGEPVVAHLVHQETTFEHEAIRRHITVLGLTESRLLIVHADDHQDDPHGPVDVATATSESVPLRDVRGVMLTHVVPDPQNYVPGSLGRELTLTLGWGPSSVLTSSRVVVRIPDDADHGFDGTITSDDIALRSRPTPTARSH